MLRNRRPQRAAEIIPARADRHRNTATTDKPERDIRQQGRESGRCAQHANQQALRERELQRTAGLRGQAKAHHLHERAQQHRHHHAVAVHQLAHHEPAGGEAQHGGCERKRGGRACDLKFVL
jgi:hypothetical protein